MKLFESPLVRLAICLAICLVPVLVQGQDVIILKDGKRINAKIIEVDDYEIRYNEWKDQGGIIFTIDRARIREIRYEFGRREQEETPGEEAVYYIDDKKAAIELNFTALSSSTLILQYEHGLSPNSSLEGAIKFNGVGFNNDDGKSGVGLALGYKVKIGSVFNRNDSYRPKHYLAGWYFKPGIGFNSVTTDSGEYTKYSYLHLGFDLGHQWVFRNSITLDLFIGWHYYGGDFDERVPGNDFFFEDEIRDGNLFGTNNSAAAIGINIGVPFGTRPDK